MKSRSTQDSCVCKNEKKANFFQDSPKAELRTGRIRRWTMEVFLDRILLDEKFSSLFFLPHKILMPRLFFRSVLRTLFRQMWEIVSTRRKCYFTILRRSPLTATGNEKESSQFLWSKKSRQREVKSRCRIREQSHHTYHQHSTLFSIIQFNALAQNPLNWSFFDISILLSIGQIFDAAKFESTLDECRKKSIYAERIRSAQHDGGVGMASEVDMWGKLNNQIECVLTRW